MRENMCSCVHLIFPNMLDMPPVKNAGVKEENNEYLEYIVTGFKRLRLDATVEEAGNNDVEANKVNTTLRKHNKEKGGKSPTKTSTKSGVKESDKKKKTKGPRELTT